MGRIDEAEEDEVAEQDAPMTVESLEKPRPIQRRRACAEEMRNIGTVVAFTLHDERLRPDHFFGGQDLYWNPDDHRVMAMLKPRLVDGTDAVPRTENDVDEMAALEGLGQPVWKPEFDLIAAVFQQVHQAVDMAGPDEHVQIFGSPDHAGVRFQRKRATDEERHAAVVQRIQRLAVEFVRRFIGHADRFHRALTY